MKNVTTGAICVFGILTSSFANAHQFWIQPSDYDPEPGERVSVFLKSGHGDKLDAVPRGTQQFTRFVVAGPEGELVVSGQEGADPAGWIKPAKVGLHTVIYQSVATRSETQPELFEAYLREESLDHVIRERAKRGETDKPGISTYVRCAKSLLNLSAATAATARKSGGLALDLSIDKGLADYRRGKPLTFVLQFEGKPAAGVAVQARDTRDPNHPINGRTDAQGKVSFALPEASEWLVTALHVIPARPGKQVDWESFLAALSFTPVAAAKQ